jgi:hypothetical protein
MTSDGAATLQSVIDDAIDNYTQDQEPYWTVAAFALYLPPQQLSWTNKFGVVHTFSDAAQHLMSRPPGQLGPCGGTHALYTLAVLQRVDTQYPEVLNAETDDAAHDFQQRACRALADTQAQDGSWGLDWARTLSDGSADGAPPVQSILAAEQSRRIWMTGHLLEWQSMLPPESRIPPPQLERAVEFLLRETTRIDPVALRQNLCAYTHGIRAIQRLWRSRHTRQPDTDLAAEH